MSQCSQTTTATQSSYDGGCLGWSYNCIEHYPLNTREKGASFGSFDNEDQTALSLDKGKSPGQRLNVARSCGCIIFVDLLLLVSGVSAMNHAAGNN